MFIENLSILDFFKFKKELKSYFKDTNKRFDLLTFFNFKKLTYDNKVIMLWVLKKLDFETSEILKVFLLNTELLINVSTNELKHKKNKTHLYITDNNLIYNSFNNKKKSNIILKMNLLNYHQDININNYNFKQFNYLEDLSLRCLIQNDVFYHNDRVPLQEKDIKYECRRDNFIPELAYFVKENNNVVGYGQILLIDDEYYIANFGIISEYRKKGYGKVLLNYLIFKAKEYGIKDICIKVDKNNKIALNLYLSVGFKVFKELNILEID